MKRIITVIGLALSVSINAQAGPIFDAIGSFFAGNPTNTWDVSAYGLKNLSTDQPGIANGLGAGGRIGYWLTPNIGAALDMSYCDSTWTFASLGIAARGTFQIGTVASVTPYVSAGPGWNIDSDSLSQSVVAVAGGGASITLKRWPAWAAFGEYVSIFGDHQQNRVQFGLTRRF